MSARQFTQNIATDGSLRKRIFRMLAGSLVVLSICYVYLIGSITFNVLARRSLEANATDIKSRVGQLELQSITLGNSIDQSFAAAHGYVEARGTIFANKNTTAVAVR